MIKNRVFLDTNIVIDLIDSSRKSYPLSLSLIEYLTLHDYEIYISEDMLSTIYYISKDKKATLEMFKNLIFIDWSVVGYGSDTIQEAVKLSLINNLDLEDVLQCLCAKKNGCEVLLTNDKRFYNCGISICNAKEFLAKEDEC